jgi:hypothetical protein
VGGIPPTPVTEGAVHGVGGVAESVGEGVTVAFHGLAHGGVAEDGHDGAGVDAAAEEEGGAGVAEVVES